MPRRGRGDLPSNSCPHKGSRTHAYVVNSNAVRAVRLGGNWNNGANDGFSNANANNAPANGNANYGGDLLPNPDQSGRSP